MSHYDSLLDQGQTLILLWGILTVAVAPNWSRTVINSPERNPGSALPSSPTWGSNFSVAACSAVKWIVRIKPKDVKQLIVLVRRINNKLSFLQLNFQISLNTLVFCFS